MWKASIKAQIMEVGLGVDWAIHTTTRLLPLFTQHPNLQGRQTSPEHGLLCTTDSLTLLYRMPKHPGFTDYTLLIPV